MELDNLLSSVHALARADKLRLIQLLAVDLAQEECVQAGEAVASFSVWSPHHAFGAAEAMLQALNDQRAAE